MPFHGTDSHRPLSPFRAFLQGVGSILVIYPSSRALYDILPQETVKESLNRYGRAVEGYLGSAIGRFEAENPHLIRDSENNGGRTDGRSSS